MFTTHSYHSVIKYVLFTCQEQYEKRSSSYIGEFNVAGNSTLTNGSYAQNLVSEERRFLIYSSFHHHMHNFGPTL
jgi:hypothetical protein